MDIQDKELMEELKKLTLARLKVMPSETEVAIGSRQYSKSDLINHVSKADEVGQELMEINLEFLQDLAKGEIYKDDDSSVAAEA